MVLIFHMLDYFPYNSIYWLLLVWFPPAFRTVSLYWFDEMLICSLADGPFSWNTDLWSCIGSSPPSWRLNNETTKEKQKKRNNKHCHSWMLWLLILCFFCTLNLLGIFEIICLVFLICNDLLVYFLKYLTLVVFDFLLIRNSV